MIVDGADNFPTRYLLNDASVWHGIPVVHGSIFRFEGQATVFQPHEGPCYRCLFPQPPPPELAPSCAEAGVLGVLPGVIGSLQANEALKLALGHRRAAGRPAAALRRAVDRVHRGRHPPRSRLPGLRRRPDDHRVHRLRGVLRRAMTTVRIPPTLRPDAGGERERPAEARPCARCSTDVGERYPALRARIFQNGNIARFVNVYVGGEDIRTQDGLDTPVATAPPSSSSPPWPAVAG